MYAPGYITREEEAKLPFFNSHEEATSWFKKKYGQEFIPTGSEMIDGQECYFYHLILDREVYEAGRKQFERDNIMTDAIKYMRSYQEIQIFVDGSIHIVY
jgi:hypothetical protein